MGIVSILRLTGLRPAVLVALAAGGLTACVASPSPPQPVEETIPTVTYNYRSDQELAAASRAADDHCRRYNGRPRTANITNNPDGSNTVVFACDRMAAASVAPAPMPPPPTVSYTYRSDQDLVNATRTAEVYCANYNTRPSPARMSQNADGSRVVTFDCNSPR